MALVRLHELDEHRRVDDGEVVGEHAQKRTISHHVGCAQHGVAEASRLRLDDDADIGEIPSGAHHFELVLLAALIQHALERRVGQEMVRHALLALRKHQDDVGGTGRHGFLCCPLDERAVEHREQLLGHRLRGGKESCAEPCGGNDAMKDVHGAEV